MNFIFLMDPLETVIADKDTSFILMLGAYRKGHRVYYLSDGGMTLENGKINFHVVHVIPQIVPDKPFLIQEKILLSQDQVDAVFIRSDPPFDHQYLVNTWLLEKLPKRIPVINNPNGIRTVNEKIWAAQFSDIVPRTLVGRHRQDLLEFIKKEQDVIAKPTDNFGGRSVFRIHQGDQNTNVILETLTENWTKDIIVQHYILEAQNGDKRILLLNGEPLGAILRVHAADDYRNNLFAGGKAQPAVITDKDKHIIEVLKPHLIHLGLYLVGIDIIGDFLIEVNVTSPTCMQEMNGFYKQNLENQVIGFVEKLVEQSKQANTINSQRD